MTSSMVTAVCHAVNDLLITIDAHISFSTFTTVPKLLILRHTTAHSLLNTWREVIRLLKSETYMTC